MKYAYICDKCGEERDKVEHSMLECDTHVETCKCGEKMRRKLQKSVFSLEGPSWARDGYCNHGMIRGHKKKVF